MTAGTTYHIGRDPKSDIVMTDSRVSWQHGVLRVDGDTWIIEDLGSTNGTFLGLQRLDRIEIRAECVVRLGNPDDGPVLRCVPQGPAPVQAGPAPGRPSRHGPVGLGRSAGPSRPASRTPPRLRILVAVGPEAGPAARRARAAPDRRAARA